MSTEQHMLGTDVLVAEARSFFARHRKYLPNTLGEVVSVHRRSRRLRLISLHMERSSDDTAAYLNQLRRYANKRQECLTAPDRSASLLSTLARNT